MEQRAYATLRGQPELRVGVVRKARHRGVPRLWMGTSLAGDTLPASATAWVRFSAPSLGRIEPTSSPRS